MKKTITILSSLLAGVAWGQPPTTVQSPAPIQSATASVIGNGGGRTLYYNVIVNYQAGPVFPNFPAITTNAPTTKNGSNYVQVNWNPMPGALSYTVLVFSDLNGAPNLFRTLTCTCAVVLNTMNNFVLDQSESLSAFTYVPLAPTVSIPPPTYNYPGQGGATVTPGTPTCNKITVSAGQFAGINTTSFNVALMTLPFHAKVTGVSVKHSTPFTGGGLSTFTVSIGDSTGSGGVSHYTSPFNIFQAAGPTVFQDTAMFKSGTMSGGSTITANFIGSGNVSLATAGSVDIRVCTVGIP